VRCFQQEFYRNVSRSYIYYQGVHLSIELIGNLAQCPLKDNPCHQNRVGLTIDRDYPRFFQNNIQHDQNRMRLAINRDY
jgi:hypothetical protein